MKESNSNLTVDRNGRCLCYVHATLLSRGVWAQNCKENNVQVWSSGESERRNRGEWADASHFTPWMRAPSNKTATWWKTSKIVPGPPHPRERKMTMSRRKKKQVGEVIHKVSRLEKKEASILWGVASSETCENEVGVKMFSPILLGEDTRGRLCRLQTEKGKEVSES